MGTFIDLTNQRFGKLLVIERAENKGRRVAWLCQCDCGKKKIVTTRDLRAGDTNSCGCLHHETQKDSMTIHGLRYDKLYNIWRSMKQRCYNENERHYADYGGRGITVCDEWRNDFQSFYNWAMANGYSDGLTIDRKDNNGIYCPENCHWTTVLGQANNKRNNYVISYKGKTQTLAEWSRELGIPYSTLHKRLTRENMSVARAFIMPVRRLLTK